MHLGGGEEVTLFLVSLEDLALPRFDRNVVFDASIHVSNSQMVWVDVALTSYDNWALLVELIFLS